MQNRAINGFIIEGADQQGKTTLVNRFVEKGLKSYKFGPPGPDFDFMDDYKNPWIDGARVYDRSFVSEMVYSDVIRNEDHRVKDHEMLSRWFKDQGCVLLILDRGNHIWINREEIFSKESIIPLKSGYRRIFRHINMEKYLIDPDKDNNFINDLISNNYSSMRLLQEIYRHDVWKMMMSCIFLNRTKRDDFDRIRCDFFFNYPDATSFLEADREVIKSTISYLGFKNRRYDMLRNFSEDFVSGIDIDKCRGVGQYALDSYIIFNRGDMSVRPSDKKLKEYLRWVHAM